MNLDEIRSVVATFGLPLAGDVSLNPSIESGVLISIYTVRDNEGRRTPSGKILSQLKEALSQRGAQVEYLLIDETASQLEDGARASLISSFPEIVRNAYVTIVDSIAHVWIDKKKDISVDEYEELLTHARTYARLFQLRGALLHVMGDFKIATPTEVLRVVRQLAPAGCEVVCEELERRGFSVPSLQWVNHRFDLLRKQGLVVRIPDRRYALTSKALHDLGTIKTRRSPDVARLLALARRGG